MIILQLKIKKQQPDSFLKICLLWNSHENKTTASDFLLIKMKGIEESFPIYLTIIHKSSNFPQLQIFSINITTKHLRLVTRN